MKIFIYPNPNIYMTGYIVENRDRFDDLVIGHVHLEDLEQVLTPNQPLSFLKNAAKQCSNL